MKKIILIIAMLSLVIIPVSAFEFTAPEAPDIAEEYMPPDTESFSEGVWFVIKTALEKTHPTLIYTTKICMSAMCAVILCSVAHTFTSDTKRVVILTGTIFLGVLLFDPANNLIQTGTRAVSDMVDYGNLFLPAITGALAVQGAVGTSTALYVGTALFSGMLSKLISSVIIPLIYLYLGIAISCCAISQPILKELKRLIKWLITWSLKIILYVFIGYIGVTGVVSGTADAAAIKATKLTISSIVPVVGSIISDASESILISVGLVKNSMGIYGLIVFLALLIDPFLQIGIPYLLLKITGSLSLTFGIKEHSEMLEEFSAVMGMLLAMTGTVALMLMVSTVCFMKGFT